MRAVVCAIFILRKAPAWETMLLCRREWVSLYSCNKDIVLAATAGGKTKRRRNGKQRQKERGEGESGGARAAWRDVVTVLVLWTGTGHVATQQRDARS